jgi:polysaccharide export outer membrane protein
MKFIWKSVVVLLLLSSIALAQDAAAASPTSDKTAGAASNNSAGPEYVIGPQDVLHVAVWKETDLTATLPVRPDGKISLPLLNDVQAAGLTPKGLGATPMLPNMTVLQALSSAGLNQFAKTKGIYVLRTENGKQTKMPVNYNKIVKGEQIEQNYLLRPGDTIVVP